LTDCLINVDFRYNHGILKIGWHAGAGRNDFTVMTIFVVVDSCLGLRSRFFWVSKLIEALSERSSSTISLHPPKEKKGRSTMTLTLKQTQDPEVLLTCINRCCDFKDIPIRVPSYVLEEDGVTMKPRYRGIEFDGFYGSPSTGGIYHGNRCLITFCED
jgi:hypothetical protein